MNPADLTAFPLGPHDRKITDPPPSPVPAGTEREALDRVLALHVKAFVEAPYRVAAPWQQKNHTTRCYAWADGYNAALSDVRAAAVVSSSPATPSREWRLFNEPSTIGPWDIEDPAPSPASPAETREGRMTQTILATPELNAIGVYGNCVQAAVASLLGKPLDAVPHVGTFATWDAALILWLRGLGLDAESHDVSAIPDEPCLVFGTSPRGYAHCVAVLADGTVWDPHPSRDGLTKVTGSWRIVEWDGDADRLSAHAASPAVSLPGEAEKP